MPFELKPNSGVLFKNKDKKEETHADYSGEILVDGQLYWLNSWIKTSTKTGDKFMSLSVKEKTQRGNPGVAKHASPPDDDPDTPF